MQKGNQIRRLTVLSLALSLAWSLQTVAAQGGPGVPGIDANKCLASKTMCVSQKIRGLLKCRENCQKSPTKCGQAQLDCEERAMNKFDGGANPARSCFAKVEARQNPAKPDTLCTTTGDTAAVEALVDDLVAQLIGALEAFCGDGVTEGTEICDDGVNDGTGPLGCLPGCQAPATCGNGVVEVPEVCDDGVNDGGEGECLPGCSGIQTCGDGIAEGTEICDDGVNDGGEGECAPGCVAIQTCGDGVAEGMEVCDDGVNDGGEGECLPGCSGIQIP